MYGGKKEKDMNWFNKLFGGKSRNKGISKKDFSEEEINKNIESGSSKTDEKTSTGRCCKCCGGTDGLYSGEDICSACDVSYYS